MIAIDLDKCFGCSKCRIAEPGVYSLIERAIRAVICRHCKNPPCVSACPVNALKTSEDGFIERCKMKCVSCKQCSIACPAGAIPSEILSQQSYPGYKMDIEKCSNACKEGAIFFTDDVPEGWVPVDNEFAVKAKGWK